MFHHKDMFAVPGGDFEPAAFIAIVSIEFTIGSDPGGQHEVRIIVHRVGGFVRHGIAGTKPDISGAFLIFGLLEFRYAAHV